METNTCCFIGHRTIEETQELKTTLYETIERLITNEKIDTFLFGSKSQFNDLCLALVTEIKEKYPQIKRVYVRAEYPYINDDYNNYLLTYYEDTYYPPKATNAGKASYIQRNFEMIEKSRFCLIYYDEEAIPNNRKSGTKIALDYAKKQNKNIILFP